MGKLIERSIWSNISIDRTVQLIEQSNWSNTYLIEQIE